VRPETPPPALPEREQGVDEQVYFELGQMASLTAATSRPAAAPASPFFTASLFMTRERYEGELSSDEVKVALFCIGTPRKASASARWVTQVSKGATYILSSASVMVAG
jgi:hypothetical protein